MKVGIGTRVINFVTDTLLIFGITYAVNQAWDFYVFYWQYTYIPFYTFFWLIMFVYYVLFEGIFARTPGKWLSFSKVVKTGTAARPAFWQVLLRSAVRLTLIDCFFLPFLEKTLHDYLSKTNVVEA